MVAKIYSKHSMKMWIWEFIRGNLIVDWKKYREESRGAEMGFRFLDFWICATEPPLLSLITYNFCMNTINGIRTGPASFGLQTTRTDLRHRLLQHRLVRTAGSRFSLDIYRWRLKLKSTLLVGWECTEWRSFVEIKATFAEQLWEAERFNNSLDGYWSEKSSRFGYFFWGRSIMRCYMVCTFNNTLGGWFVKKLAKIISKLAADKLSIFRQKIIYLIS